MSNLQLQVNQASVKSFVSWSWHGFKQLGQNPVLYLTISLFWLAVFAIAFIIGINFQQNFLVASVMALGISLIFPFTLASLTIAELRKDNHQSISPRLLLDDCWRGLTLRLIIIYILLILAVSFGSSYLMFSFPAQAMMISYASEMLYLILQLLILLALPANICLGGRIKPYHALAYAARAFLINFIPCMLFLAAFFVLLFIAILLAQLLTMFMGKLAIIVYITELWLFVTILSLSAGKMARELVASAEKI